MTSDDHRRESPGTDAEPGGPDGLAVGRTAALVGVSVKTLHHWDAIGLVRPSERTWAGYRVYSGKDVARIQLVLVYRELGFPLAEIGQILDDPKTGARARLRRQRSQLVERIARLEAMVHAVDRMVEASGTAMRLSQREQLDVFGDGWQPAWVDEAEERWGDTAQWSQYAERAAGMTAAQWTEVAAATAALDADLARAKLSGAVPDSGEARELAERHRALLSTYFDCTHAMHVCIGRMYASEPGYARHYDAVAPGLARWLRDVILANAEAHGVDPDSAGRE
ncbi:MerR family transcriptional regulator [Streptomyces wuyuanensis]|uniref:MerR family transcriptional regulator n=1 Tax=Streptomyces wuyuanensis TaxID=1196353 RepID=UPI0037BCFF08